MYVFVCVDLPLCMSSSQKWWTCCGPGCLKTTRRTGDEFTRYGYSSVLFCQGLFKLSLSASLCRYIVHVRCRDFRRSRLSVWFSAISKQFLGSFLNPPGSLYMWSAKIRGENLNYILVSGPHNYVDWCAIIRSYARAKEEWVKSKTELTHSISLCKALLLLAYLIRNGSERVVTSAREHIYDLRSLENYHFIGKSLNEN